MRKIPTLFVRDPDDRAHVTREVSPGCEWVVQGEGVSTRKYDGKCVLFDGERWWQVDVVTDKAVGWEPVEQSPFRRFHAEAVAGVEDIAPGTYELCGPKVQGDAEGFGRHVVVQHSRAEVVDAPRDYVGLRQWLLAHDYEGVVWRHPDGRMAKIKTRDFPRD